MRRSLFRWFSRSNDPRPRRRAQPPRTQLSVEPLEERALPAAGITAFDQAFLAQAAQTSLLGFEVASVAAARAVSSGVRQFAQGVAAGYAQALSQLTPLLTAAGVSAPVPGDIDRQLLARLAAQRGRFVDMTFLQINAQLSLSGVALYSAASAQIAALGPGIADAVNGTLPVLSQNLSSSASALSGGGYGNSPTAFLTSLSASAGQVLATIAASRPSS